MIISHSRKFIFAAIPKTGTHSVREALRQQLGPADLEQARLFVEKRFPWPELAAKGHGHLGLDEVRPFLGDETFSGYLKFAFVRNPFDRFISYCAFATSKQGAFDRDPRGVMRHFLFSAPPLQHIVFRPQNSFIVGADGQVLADMLGRVEDMQASYDAICERLNMPSSQLGRKNSSQHRDYRSYYDQQLLDGVAKLYARDLELFGYDF